MNQILMTENKKRQKKQRNSGPMETKSIVRFFAIVIIIFGLSLICNGSYAIYKDAEERKPANMPTVSIGRLNDKAILYVENSIQISKISYSWDNGEVTVLPQGTTIAQEEILLPNQNSVLNITIEDMNGKKVNYQKAYNLEGMDIQKPEITIEQSTDNNKKLIITAKDEKEIAYMSYNWEGEDAITINAETPGQTEIVRELDLEPGNKKINVIAKDANGNITQQEQEIIITTSELKMQIIQEGNKIIIEAEDEDGVKDISVNLNGKKYAATDINLKYVQVGPVELQEGNNTILVEVTNINGYTKKGTTEIKNP